MNDAFISFETAKLAKEKGFNEETLHYYYKDELQSPYVENGSSTDVEFRVDLEDLYDYHNNEYLKERYSAPTQSLLQKWLREEYNINIGMVYYSLIDSTSTRNYWTWRVHYTQNAYGNKPTYEEALEEALQEALKLI